MHSSLKNTILVAAALLERAVLTTYYNELLLVLPRVDVV
jgi:hypothetical protein